MGLTERLDALGEKWYTKTFVAVCVFALVAMIGTAINEQGNAEYFRQVDECHSIYGKENITFEVVEDGCYMAYINDTLVYAGGHTVDDEHPYRYTPPIIYALAATLLVTSPFIIWAYFAGKHK